MDLVHLILVLFFLLNIAAVMGRVVRGPTAADRLMTAQLFGTTGVALLLVLSEVNRQPALRNVALIFALLAVLVVICFVRSAATAGSGVDER